MNNKENPIVIVVEDDCVQRELLVEILSLHFEECSVIPAVNGRDGLKKIRENNGGVKLIITDFLMDDMTGGDMLLELDRSAEGQVPRIVVSGSVREREGVLARFDAWFEKPCKITELISKAKELMK